MKGITVQEEKSDRRSFVRIRAGTIEALGDLRKVWNLYVFRHTAKELKGGAFEVHGLLTEAEIETIRSQGYELKLISDGDEVARQRLKELYRKKMSEQAM
jgi:hypothetical protein